mgnify:FL=1
MTQTHSPIGAAQKQFLRENGFLHLRGAIPTPILERALGTISHRLGEGIPAEELQTWRSQSFFPELKTHGALLDLFNQTPAIELVRELLGQTNVAPAKSCQLALRFPAPPGTNARPPYPHIDGVHSPHNGVPQGELHSFSALVGIFLTDVTRQNAGNFTVWPGSHRKMEAYFAQNGVDELLAEGKTPAIERGEPLQIEAKAGDCVIAHYQLLHGVAQNVAPFPRFATFFRIKHPEHETHKIQCLRNLWLEWPGLND